MTFLKQCHYPYDMQLSDVDHIWLLKLLCFRFHVHKTEGLSNCNQSKDKLFFRRKGDVTLSTSFVFDNCASISVFISDPVFNVLFYIPEGNSPLDHCLTTVS